MFRPVVPLVACIVALGCEPNPDPAGDSGSAGSGDETDSQSGSDETSGDPETSGGSTSSSDEPQPGDVEVGDAIAAGHNVGSQLVQDGQGAAQVAAEAVEFASVSAGTGQLVTTGTVRQQGEAYTYEPGPSEALVVVANGETVRFEIETMQGDLSSASAFLGSTHEFRMVVQADQRIDAEIHSQRMGTNYVATLSGDLWFAGQPLDVDATVTGSDISEVDTSGSHFQSDYRITGTVAGPGFEMQLDETWDFELVTSRGDGGSDSAQSATRTLANIMDVGTDHYQWVDVMTHKSYRQGVPSQTDTEWACRGQILRNGQNFGQYRFDANVIDPGAGGFLLFMLDLPGGTQELERIAAY